MKRFIVLFLGLLLLCGVVFAEESEPVWWGSYYKPGNFSLALPLSFDTSGSNMGILIYPEAEISLWKPVIGGIAPLDVGAAAKARVGFMFGNNYSGLGIGAGLLVTAHLGFRGLDIPFSEHLEKLDYFIQMGIAADFIRPPEDSLLGFATFTGLNYYLKPGFALSAMYTYWKGYSGAAVGVKLRFGPSPEIESQDFSGRIKQAYYSMYLAQFYSLYWLSFYAGGFFFDDSNYPVGTGTRWLISAKDSSGETDSFMVERALLKSNPDGTKWWKAVFVFDDETLAYEFLLAPDYSLLKLRFRAKETGEIMEYDAASQPGWQAVPTQALAESDYSAWAVGKERIRVKAGTFQTDHLVMVNKDENYSYEWWVSRDVPGRLVQFLHKDSEDEHTGELLEITKGNTTELNSF